MCVFVCVCTRAQKLQKQTHKSMEALYPPTKLHSHNAENFSVKLVVLRNKDSKVLLD